MKKKKKKKKETIARLLCSWSNHPYAQAHEQESWKWMWPTPRIIIIGSDVREAFYYEKYIAVHTENSVK